MHLGNRIAQIIPPLLLVSMVVFGLQQLMPGDPAMVLADIWYVVINPRLRGS